MALGGEANIMKKDAEKRQGGGSVWKVILLLIVIVILLIFVIMHDQTNSKEKDAVQSPTEVEVLIPTRNVEVDEKGVPTPDSLKQIEESQAMEEYYRMQSEEAEKHMLLEQEQDDLSGQPY